MPAAEPARGRTALAALVVVVVGLLPFARGLSSGASLYFRDLALQFLPMRRFALDGLRRGEIRLWNPYVHEGVPLSLPPLGYPVDLLQLLRPDAFGISLVLLLHVPLAGALFLLLARSLGFSRLAAAGGALAYALGGFLLSTLNLYVYAQAAAWAPLIVLGFIRVGEGRGRRALALAATALAIGLSTTGIEIVAQALLVGLLLGWPARSQLARRLPELASAVLLGILLAAPVLVLVAGMIEGSARGRGFATDVVLAHSVHPFTFVQTIVAGLYGDLRDLANHWWGQNFFPRGFPYVLSLYLGATTLALAAAGARSAAPRLARRLLVLLAAGVVVALGRWAGLGPLVDALPFLHAVRYPVKAFFLVHVATALLATAGIAALESVDSRRAWRRFAVAAGVVGGGLVLALGLPLLAPAATEAFGQRFFPPDFPSEMRAASLARVLLDAVAGGALALLAALLALLVLLGRLEPARGAALAVALMGADLLRAGGGMNPMVSPAFLEPSPELTAALPDLREGRVFACDTLQSPAYTAGRKARPRDHELWSFAVAIETLTPFANAPLGVASAFSPDLTMLVPEDRVPTKRMGSCRHLDETIEPLRAAGVRTLLSLDPLAHAELEAADGYAPRRIAPLAVNVYRLAHPRPLLALSTEADSGNRILSVERRGDDLTIDLLAAAPGRLLLREAYAPSWRARVDGRPAPIERVEGHYMAVPLAAGRQSVDLRYRPTLLPFALAASGLALVFLLGLVARPPASAGAQAR